jgi:hypothetical protein
VKFKIWNDGDSAEDGSDVDGVDVREAATSYAEKRWTPDYGEEMSLIVLDEAGDLHEVGIDIDFEPTFYASVTGKHSAASASEDQH